MTNKKNFFNLEQLENEIQKTAIKIDRIIGL
jgi:hypothetical protein